MANLAIKGHATRGKEVIELLEMLGGSNPHNYSADCESLCFHIGENTNSIYYDWVRDCYEDGNTLVFTLEEFLEKYPYKIGDSVSSKYLKNYKIEKAEWESCNNRVIYKLQGMGWYSVEELQPYKEETMDKVSKAVFDVNALCCDIMNHLIKEETMQEQIMTEDITLEKSVMCTFSEVVEGKQRLRIAMNEGFELKEENGNFFVYRKKVGYPKTYEECASILCDRASFRNNIGYKGNLLVNLQQLLVCRDAYWKIAGEQMDLGKPWEPDYTDDNVKYIIGIHRNHLDLNCTIERNYILIFPSEEIRDAFLENFKDLIELCKELL